MIEIKIINPTYHNKNQTTKFIFNNELKEPNEIFKYIVSFFSIKRLDLFKKSENITLMIFYNMKFKIYTNIDLIDIYDIYDILCNNLLNKNNCVNLNKKEHQNKIYDFYSELKEIDNYNSFI